MFACKRSDRASAPPPATDVTVPIDNTSSSVDACSTPATTVTAIAQRVTPPWLTSSRSTGLPTAIDAAYMATLRDMQKLVTELLGVHALSSALEYRAHAPIRVNACAWWREVQQQSILASQKRRRPASTTPSSSSNTVATAKLLMKDLMTTLDRDAYVLHEVYADTLLLLLESLDRLNRLYAQGADSVDRASVDSIVASADDAVAFAASELLESWDAASSDNTLSSGASGTPQRAAVTIVNMVLQCCDIGSPHAFHAHALVASSVRRVFGRAPSWRCAVCRRVSTVKGPAAPLLVYRCAACDFNLCRECFTRIPNDVSWPASSASDSSSSMYAPVVMPVRKLHVARFFQLALGALATRASFSVVTGRLAFALRQRVKELPAYRVHELAATGALLIDMLASPSVALAIVDHGDNDWFPVYMNTWMMGALSFLGPFVRGSSLTDELRTGSSTQTGSVLGPEWRDSYKALKTTYVAIVRALLAPSQHPRVAHATLAWLGCTVLSTTKRRRMSRETNDTLDGFLINVSTILVALSLPALNADAQRPGLLDATYHTHAVSMRAFGDKTVREAPLQDLASVRGEQYVLDKLAAEDGAQRQRDRRTVAQFQSRRRAGSADTVTESLDYYPSRDAHYGVACNHCYQQNFQSVRYKCAFCDDMDICGTCFALFARQSASARGCIDSILATGLDSPQVHMLDHVFIRVGTPVPLYETRHFEMIKFDKDAFRIPEASSPTGADTVTPAPPLQCADCSCSIEDADVAFKCSNCLDARFVCTACVEREESWRDPHRMHVPGHLYFAITSSWRFTYAPTTPALHYRSLSHPSALLPRIASNQETELLYMAIKSLHYGPLLTLSKLLSVLKERQDLQAFCYCEEERLKYETKQQRRSSTRSRRTLKLSSHYSTSKARIGDLDAKIALTELHVLEVSTVAEWLVFYAKTSRWLLSLASPTQDAHGVVLTDVSDALLQFPEHFFTDVCDFVYVLGLERLEYHAIVAAFTSGGTVVAAADVVGPIAVLLTQLLASRALTRNPHVRVQALKALIALLAFFSKSKHNNVVRAVFDESPLLRSAMVSSVLTFHDEMEKYHVRNNGLGFNSNVSSGDHLLWGFLPTRVSVTLLLRYLWQVPSQRKAIATVFQLGPLAPSPASTVSSHMSVLVSGLWSDVAKLLDEGLSKIETLLQLREIQASAVDGSLVAIPFRPAMMDGYIALHAKQLRLTFRMLIEALELLSWMGASGPFKKVMLKPELSDQCARIVSFLIATIGAAHEAQTWTFSAQLARDSKLVLANLVLLVVRCAGLSDACPASSSWTLMQESGLAMVNSIGDLDTRARWGLHAAATRLESATFLCETVDDASTDGDDTSSQDDDARVPLDDTSEDNDDASRDDDDDMDEDAALALLEKQAADAVVAATRSSSNGDDRMATSRRQRQAQSIARHLGRRFVSSLAKDGRFDYTRFVNALELLRRRSSASSDVREYDYVDASWVLQYLDAMKQCREMIQLHASMDAFLGEVPDEYLDPLLSTIMTDPVRLPSGQVVDRAVIERHLLSSQPVDPFTREPLTVEMLVPCDALRREIRLYLRSKMQHFQNDKQEDVLATWGLAWNVLFDDSDCVRTDE